MRGLSSNSSEPIGVTLPVAPKKPRPVNAISSVVRFLGSIPVSTLVSRIRVLISSPAPVSSTSAVEICSTTNALRSRSLPDDAVAERPPALNAVDRSSRDPCHAGSMPKTTDVNSDTTAVKARTVGLSDTSFSRGSHCGSHFNSALMPSATTIRQTTAPSDASTRLSVSS